jgi:hypothetical protein
MADAGVRWSWSWHALLQWKNPRQYGRNAILGLASRPLLEFI